MAKIRANTGGGGVTIPLEPSNTSPDEIEALKDYHALADGYAVESVTPINPSISSPITLEEDNIYLLGSDGYAIDNYNEVTASDSNPPMIGGMTYVTNGGFAVEHSVSSLAPSDSSPATIFRGNLYRATADGEAVAEARGVMPSDTGLSALDDTKVYRPLADGYFVATQPTEIVPNNSSPIALSDGGMYNANGAGYAIASYSEATASNSTPPDLAADSIYKIKTTGGKLVKSIDSVTPQNIAPPLMMSSKVYKPTVGCYAVSSVTNLAPSDSTPQALTGGNIYKPTVNPNVTAGYAIESYSDVTPSASGASFSAGMVKMSSSGYAYSQRPVSYSNMILLDTPINPSKSGDVIAFYLDGRPVYIRTETTYVSLVCVKDDETESVINLITNMSEDLTEEFSLYEIHYLDAGTVLIFFEYPTNATSGAMSAKSVRMVAVKNDGTLSSYGNVSVIAAATAAQRNTGFLIPGFYGDWTGIASKETISTGAKTLGSLSYYLTVSNSRIVQDTNGATVINITTADVDVALQDTERSIFKGAFFYKNANGAAMVYVYASHMTASGGNKSVTLANAGTEFNTFIGNDLLHSYVIGFMKCGLLLVGKMSAGGDGAVNCYLTAWNYDHTSTTNLFKPRSVYQGQGGGGGALVPYIELEANERIVSFNNDMIITNLGKQYSVSFGTDEDENEVINISQKNTLTVTHGFPSGVSGQTIMKRMRGQSDPYNGVFIY